MRSPGSAARSLLLPPGVFPRVSLHPPPLHPGPGARSGAGVAKPASLGGYLWQVSGLPYWRERIADHAPPRARAGSDEPFIARARSAADRTRGAPAARRLRLLALASIVGRQRGAAGLLAGAGAARPAVPAHVPAGRAHRLSAGAGRCCATRAPPAAPRWSGGSPGTCPTTPSTTPTRRCRSTRCRRRTRCSRTRIAVQAGATSRSSARSWAGSAAAAGRGPERKNQRSPARAQAMQSGVVGSNSSRSRPMSSPQRRQKP